MLHAKMKDFHSKFKYGGIDSVEFITVSSNIFYLTNPFE